MRGANAGASSQQIRAELFPEDDFSGAGIQLIDLAGALGSPRGKQIQGTRIGAPTDDAIVGIDTRDGAQATAVHGPNAELAPRVSDGNFGAVLGESGSDDAFRGEGPGFSITHVDKVVAAAVSGFNACSQQVLAIGKKANPAVTDALIRQLPGLTRSGWDQGEAVALKRFGDDPLIVWRNGASFAFAHAYRRRAVGVAQEGGVVWTAALGFFLKQNFCSVPADVAKVRPPEPPKFALLFSAWLQSADIEPLLMGNHEGHAVAKILEPHAARHVGDGTHLAVQGGRAQVFGTAAIGGREPNLVACRRPENALQRSPAAGELLLVSLEVNDGDRAFIVAIGILMIRNGHEPSVWGDFGIADPIDAVEEHLADGVFQPPVRRLRDQPDDRKVLSVSRPIGILHVFENLSGRTGTERNPGEGSGPLVSGKILGVDADREFASL